MGGCRRGGGGQVPGLLRNGGAGFYLDRGFRSDQSLAARRSSEARAEIDID